MNFKSKVIWVTGASSGIGEALVYELNRLGASLIISARNTNELERVKNTAANKNAEIKILPVDISIVELSDANVERAIGLYGKVDILINNAGVSQRSLAKDTPINVDESLMRINYLGTVALTKALLPHFIQRQSGHFVVVTSAVGKFGSPWRSGYAAAKHALHGFFDSLRAEIHDYNIKVLLICPGFVRTNVSVNALNEKGEALREMDAATAKGLSPEYTAKQIVKAIENNKEEVLIGGAKEHFGAYMKRFLPSVFSVMVRKMTVR